MAEDYNLVDNGAYSDACEKSYHTSHLRIGFILVPGGHWNALENSRMLDKGPRTR